MDPEVTQAAFRIAYYRFAVRDWQAELATGFLRLKRFRSGFAQRALAMFEGLSPEEQSDLAAALLRKAHPEAAIELSTHLTDRQAVLLQAREEGILRGSSEEDAAESDVTLRRSQLAKMLKSKMRSLGALEPMGSRSTWRYRSNQGPFVVLTYVDVGGRIWDLSYHHDVLVGDVRLHRFISFLAWLGVGASKWTLRSEEEAAEAVDLLQELCSHFMVALRDFEDLARQ